MTAAKVTPLGAVLSGAVAGAVGTLAMDLVWYRRHRRRGGESGFTDWEFSTGTEGYEGAPAPAQVGKRLVEGLFDTELPPETASITNNIVHWLTGVSWGAAHGVVAASTRIPATVLGPFTGVVAWVAGYAALAPAGIYRPMWEYDPVTLWKDVSAHLVFGAATGVTFRVLIRLGG